MYRHWQTDLTGVLVGQVNNLCHVTLQDGGTQLALDSSLLGLRTALLLLVEYAHTPCVPGLTTAVRIERQFARPPFTSPLLHLEKEPFGGILIGSDSTTTCHTSARWSDHQTL